MSEILNYNDLDTDEPTKTCGKRFIKIWDFMLMDLGLEKTELLVYAIIFSMHRNYCECFMGTREYLQTWTNSCKSAVIKALTSLEEKKLITKEFRRYNNARKAVYFINTEALPSCEMFALENRNRDNNERIRRKNEQTRK